MKATVKERIAMVCTFLLMAFTRLRTRIYGRIEKSIGRNIENEKELKEIKDKLIQESEIQKEKVVEQTKRIKSQTEKLLNKEMNIQIFWTTVSSIVAFILMIALMWGAAFSMQYLLQGLGVGVPICVGMAIFNYIVSRKNKMRILRLSNALKEAAKGNFDVQLDKRDAGSFGETYEDFNEMCRALKEMNSDMQDAIEEAKAANEAKSNFLSNVSHEIRTPINAILGFDEMIIRESNEDYIKDYAYNIKGAGKSLLGLVNDLLDFSKIESGKMEIIPVEYDLSSLLNDLLSMISIKAEEKGLDLKVMVEPSIPHILYGDEIRIKQILLNILSNAVKYTPQGSISLSVEYKKAEEDGIFLRFKVKDTGIGIKEEDIEKLFSPFERIEEERNRTIEGTGLGLSITKQLLSMMGSGLSVDSVYGEGTEFSFTVIQRVIDWEEIGNFADTYREMKYREKEYQESFVAPEAKILVVDDTAMNLTVIKGLLKQTKIQIDTAESGRECLALAAEKEYHVIFLDHRMPEMDGIETLHRLKRLEGNKNKNTPVVALTANVLSGARAEYIKEGFSDYLSKPVDTRKLEKTLLMYLPKELAEVKTAGHPAEEIVSEKTRFQISGLDVNMGMDACGSMETFQKVLKDFYVTVESKAGEIEGYWKTGDYRNYTIKVHALKSSARLIGATELSEMAGYLEECGDDGKIEEINDKTEELLQGYRKLAQEIEPYITAGEENDNRPDIDQDSLQEALSTLCEFVEVFDFESADSVMRMLEDYKIPEEFNGKMEQLKVLMANVDRDNIIQLIKAGKD